MEPGTLINGRFRVEKKIGGGSFGEIFIALDGNRTVASPSAQPRYVAVKCEPRCSKHPQIFYEAKIYKILLGGKGFPEMFWYGCEGNFNILVMELLGPSLEDIFAHNRRKMSLRAVLMLAEQMFDRIEWLHKKSIIHRDIKPDNFVYGCPGHGHNNDLVYLLDYGLAKKYRDPKTHEHIPMKTGKNLTGTARYVSINTHLGIEPSRRDDLESLCYVWLYFLRGSLPWQGQKGSKREKYQKIMALKIDTSIDDLMGTCFRGQMNGKGSSSDRAGGSRLSGQIGRNARGSVNRWGREEDQPKYPSNSGSGEENYWSLTLATFTNPLPDEFRIYLQYCRQLRYEDAPDYAYLRGLVKDMFYREGYAHGKIFESIPVKLQSRHLGASRNM